jgi:hypothetical protein
LATELVRVRPHLFNAGHYGNNGLRDLPHLAKMDNCGSHNSNQRPFFRLPMALAEVQRSPAVIANGSSPLLWS